MEKLLSTIILAVLFFANLSAQNTEELEFKVEEYTLDNGLKVFLHEDHTTPEVFGVVITRVGGKNDPKDATGLAHYMEHMLFKGTQKLGTTNWEKEQSYIDQIFKLYDELGKAESEDEKASIQKEINEASVKANEYAIPNEMSNLIKSIGGTNLNAGTGPDVTMFYNAFPPHQMEKWLELYSHRFINPVFRSFQAELEVVYEEKNMYADMFQFSLLEEFQKRFFKNHPYGQQPLIGTIEHLKNPSLTKMFDFYQTYYVANNMALILSGDFDPEKVKPMINKKFGQWHSGPVPENAIYEEKEFEGREFIEAKLSPIKLGILGFRTVPAGHPDEMLLKVTNQILTNSNSTGLLDKLMLDNQLMAAVTLELPYNDHGGTVILMIPKLVGQKLEEAEYLVLAQLDKLKKGEFQDNILEAIKMSTYVKFKKDMESSSNVALKIAEAYGRNQDIREIALQPSRIMEISKEDIIQTAIKYYGENYLAFYSRMGSAKKEKIEKPGYEPVISNREAKSEFAVHFGQMQAAKPEVKPIDFNNDIKQMEVNDKYVIYTTPNPVNDIFKMRIKFGYGTTDDKALGYIAQLMNYAGTKEMTVDETKLEFAMLGCDYSFSANQNYLMIDLSGLENKLEPALQLLKNIMDDPHIPEDKLKIILDEAKTIRKIEQSEPENMADALYNFVLYGPKSDYLDRYSMKEIKDLDIEKLLEVYRKALNYKVSIHYSGAQDVNQLADKIQHLVDPNNIINNSEAPYVKLAQIYKENTIYFVHNKKAVQSKVYFFANGYDYTRADEYVRDAFNTYFGGGFSGLVLQEIREYRSMAYNAGAYFGAPAREEYPANFIGYLGTQADKTNDAIDIYMDLIRNMPEKTERLEMIRDYLSQAIITQKPGFRNLSERIEAWKLLGYENDPTPDLIDAYENLQFNDITTFYKQHLAEKPIVISIVGNKKKVDTEALKQYGRVVMIKSKKLFRE